MRLVTAAQFLEYSSIVSRDCFRGGMLDPQGLFGNSKRLSDQRFRFVETLLREVDSREIVQILGGTESANVPD
jgi:hypothetical protein